MRSLSGTPFGVIKGLLTCEIGVKSFSANKLSVSPSRRCGGEMGVGMLGKRSVRFDCDIYFLNCFGCCQVQWILQSYLAYVS